MYGRDRAACGQKPAGSTRFRPLQVHNSSKLMEIQKAHIKLLQDAPPAELPDAVKKAIADALASANGRTSAPPRTHL